MLHPPTQWHLQNYMHPNTGDFRAFRRGASDMNYDPHPVTPRDPDGATVSRLSRRRRGEVRRGGREGGEDHTPSGRSTMIMIFFPPYTQEIYKNPT